jgi:hypothetical protein
MFSNATYHGKPSLPPTVAGRNWVSSADGTEVRFLTIEDLRPTLHDPFTGEFTRLPILPDAIAQWEEENPRGVIHKDGTTFLYSIWCVGDYRARFRAALLPPGRHMWTVVERTLQAPIYGEFCATYQRGKIMVTMEATLWRVITPEGGDHDSDLLVMRPPLPWWGAQYYSRGYSYVLESRGELLWASVKIKNYSDRQGNVSHDISMTVHVLEVEASASVSAPENKTRWVKKDGGCMMDRVLFLGTPISFAVDASTLGGLEGGSAYFIYHRSPGLRREKVGVFSYNLLSGKAKFLERLPRGWSDERCTWHVLQPTIDPIQVNNTNNNISHYFSF